MTDRRVDRGLVPHPAWCDPDYCDVYDEGDGTLAVFHERRLLDEIRGGRKHGRTVSLVQSVTVARDSGSVVELGSHVFVDGHSSDAHRIGSEELPRVCAAVMRATELLGLPMQPPG